MVTRVWSIVYEEDGTFTLRNGQRSCRFEAWWSFEDGTTLRCVTCDLALEDGIEHLEGEHGW